MAVVTEAAGSPPPAPHGRAGRNLPVAIGVGLAMAAVLLATVYFARPFFVAVIDLAVVVGLLELRGAMASAGIHLPLPPLLVGGVLVPLAAQADGPEAMLVALLLTCFAVAAWRLTGPVEGYLQDVGASVLATVYVPLGGGFCALVVDHPDGARRILAYIVTVVCSDVGGYAAGVLAGRHPMAPTVSPKKSWEGFGGSVLLCSASGIVILTLLLHAQWWQGLIYGLAVVATATLGDLGESLVKRDLGIKDMGRLLPGHGGLMDRMDSLLPTAPVAWLLLQGFAGR